MAPLFGVYTAAPQFKFAVLSRYGSNVKLLSQYFTRRIVAKLNPELGSRD